jgi:hypothetical protein
MCSTERTEKRRISGRIIVGGIISQRLDQGLDYFAPIILPESSLAPRRCPASYLDSVSPRARRSS